MYDPLERENEIMEVLRELAGKGLDFIVIGGYGVSAYKHRFSVDADIVIRKDDQPKFEDVLKKRGYKISKSRQLGGDYSSEYVMYENGETKTSVDLLIGGVAVRQTGASFGFDFLQENSGEMEIEGINKSVKARVPQREILVAMKLHSGRPTDLRDVVALASGLDINKIRKIISRGDTKVLERHIKSLGEMVSRQDFQDSFKGVFMEKNYRIDIDEIRKLARLAEK